MIRWLWVGGVGMALMGCHEADTTKGAPDASALEADASREDEAHLQIADAATEDAGADSGTRNEAVDAGVARVGPCARCSDDEYCLVVTGSGGVQRPPPYRSAGVGRASCKKLPMPACSKLQCACLGIELAIKCKAQDGRLRVDVRVMAP
ncbi:MAG: hypothetical protein ABI461_06420 [Polyangiaceae bacterium]